MGGLDVDVMRYGFVFVYFMNEDLFGDEVSDEVRAGVRKCHFMDRRPTRE